MVFLAVLAGVLGYVTLGPAARLDTADKLANIGALILAAVTFVLTLRPVPLVTVGQVPDERAAADLARLVRRQWAQEAAVRLLRRPRALAVGWSVSTRAAAPSGEVFGLGAPRTAPGDVTDLVRLFRRLPARRLVVTGAPGSGKTVAALLLTLDLLAERQPGERVPVLLPLSTWDTGEPYEDWLARRLGEEYPTLVGRGQYRPDALAGLVLPVLDGLDELPRARRVAALAALDTQLPDQPLVLTCRTDAYGEAVAANGSPLNRAAVVDLAPVTAAAAAGYLPAGQVDGAQRWTPVVAELRERPEGPLTRALSTPLMVYLARTVYTAPGADPADLVDPARFADQAAIAAHLLDRYLPAVYAGRGYPAERAAAWLAFLAARLPGPAGEDLAWWDLPRWVDRWPRVAGTVTGILGGLTGGLATATGVTILAGPAWGVPAGLLVALHLATMCARGYGRGRPATRPRLVRLRLRTVLRPTRASLLRGTQCAVLIVVQVGLFLGLAIGFQQGLTAGLATGTVVGFCVGLPGGFVEYVVQNLVRPADETDRVDPRSSLAGDRAACLLQAAVGGLLFAPAFGLIVGVLADPLAGLYTGLVCGFASAVLGALLTGFPPERMPNAGLGWVPYVIARGWLAAHGRLPWRLLRFLGDAHDRGVLRQNGVVYQFRHASVREHLTGATASRTPPTTRPVVSATG
jgi:NACHT domain